jgi:Uma2 family endonuclease
MTYAEFLEWADEDTLAEWVNGEVVILSPAGNEHAGGVREYWPIDPQRRQAEFYQLGEDGIYRLVPPDESGVYRSAVLAGLWLKVDWPWHEPRPTLLSICRKSGLV